MKKNIANGFTLLNLVFGCLAIVSALEIGLATTSDAGGETIIILPEKIFYASFFIGCAAMVDFLDGFVARLLHISSELGKQLDSLADVVSFGVTPGIIVYQFLRLSMAQQANGLDAGVVWLLPAFLIPVAGAYRLGRFNLDTSDSMVFKGVPIPAVGLFIASFPLIYWYSGVSWIIQLLVNKWSWYVVILIVSYLMTSRMPMLSLKFKHFSVRKDWPILALAIVSIIGAFAIGWATVPVVFVLYVLLSVMTLKKGE